MSGAADFGGDTVTLTATDTLAGMLAGVPEARAERVTQAIASVADVSYPPLVLIEKLSMLFACQLLGGGSGSGATQPGQSE